MKNPFFFGVILLLILAMSETTNAQLNIQAGINSASMKFEISGFSLETGSTNGFNLGVNYRNRISNKFFFSPGALFSQKGAKLEFDFGGGSESAELKLNYLEIPLMFTYQSNETKGFFAEGGPYFAYLLSVDSEDGDEEGYKNTDFGVGLGAGYDFGQFILGLRGTVGISSLADDVDFEDGTVTNNVGSIYGAYKF
jgi:hypothetical protein